MKRGFVKSVRGKSADKQEAELQAAGIEVIYRDDLVDAIASLRKGDTLAVAAGLHVLSPIRRGILEIVQEVHAAGCVVEDITHGHRSEGDGIPMLALAIDAISAETRFGDPKKAGKQGAAKRWAKVKKTRTPQRKAYARWKDASLTTKEALAHPDMEGWTRRAAYDKFGKRDIRPGRMPDQ